MLAYTYTGYTGFVNKLVRHARAEPSHLFAFASGSHSRTEDAGRHIATSSEVGLPGPTTIASEHKEKRPKLTQSNRESSPLLLFQSQWNCARVCHRLNQVT